MSLRDLRAIAALGSPVFVGQVAVMLNGAADTVMAGHYSARDLAAVSIGNSIYVTVFVALSGILQGLSPIVAHHFGAGRYPRIGEDVRQAVWLALALAVPAVPILAFPGFVLGLADIPPDVAPIAARYLQATATGLPAVLLSRTLFAFAPAAGRARMVMTINLAALCLKIPLNYGLLYGRGGLPELGAAGCAIASSLEYWAVLSVTVAVLRFDDYFRRFGLFARPTPPNAEALGRILRLGVPIGLSMLVEVTSYTFMALLLARLGARVSAAHQIVANLGAMLYMLPLSVGTAVQILIGQSLGAEDPGRAWRIARQGIGLGAGFGASLCLAVYFGRGALVALYSNDPAVQAIALGLLPLLAAYHFWDEIQCQLIQVLRGYHRTLAPMIINAATLWIVGLGGGYLLAFIGVTWPIAVAPMGAAGFWLCAVASIMASSVVLFAYLRDVAGHISVHGHRAAPPG